MSEPPSAPFRVRYRVPLAVSPFAVGIVVTVLMWGQRADKIFFSTAAEVIALGAVAMALQGRFFRISGGQRKRASSGYAMASVLIAVGVGLGFAFGALAREGGGGDAHLALTTGALCMGVAAFTIMALVGTPGAEDDE